MNDSPGWIPSGETTPRAQELFAQLEQLRRGLQEQGSQYQTELATLEQQLRHELQDLWEAVEQEARQIEAQQQRLRQQQEALAQQRSRLARRLWRLRSRWNRSGEPDPAWVEKLQQAQQALEQMDTQLQQAGEQIAQLEEENRQLRDQLVQSSTSSTLTDSGELTALRQELEDYRRRYEMALEDLRAEKAKVAELQQRLEGLSKDSLWDEDSSLDWEVQKQRLLAALEADFDEEDPQQNQQRLQLEEVIRRTDRIVAEKDREIAELKKLLQQQSATWEGMAVGAAAVAELLDKDEIIRQERENLKALQEQWKEKLRKAEVELSLERAKLARQKTEIEDKLHELQQKLAQLEKMELSARAAAAENTRNKTRRWLKRLGLLGSEDSDQ